MGIFDNLNLAGATKFLSENREVLVTGASFAAILLTLYRQSHVNDVTKDVQRLAELSKQETNAKSRMLAGKQYIEDDHLKQMKASARNICFAFNQETDGKKRDLLLRNLFGEIGEGCNIQSPFSVEYGSHITVGDNVKIHSNCVLSDAAGIDIGSNVCISPGVTLSSQTYPHEAVARRTDRFAKKICIGSDVWIGAGVVILPGVTIGSNCIIAANATVTGDIASGKVVAGVPARDVGQTKKLDDMLEN